MLRPTRLLALGGIALLGLLYWKPVHTYLSTQHELHQRQALAGQLIEQVMNLRFGPDINAARRFIDDENGALARQPFGQAFGSDVLILL